VVVGPRSSGTREVRLRDVNWLGVSPGAGLRCAVKLRAREAPQPATVMPRGDAAEVWLDRPALPAPGQACVFYDGERVLGGGWIISRTDATRPVDAAPPAALSAQPDDGMAA
ncbi:MAG TPA: aminomethyltransferase beta-barrel domain-containing protein, partial [Acetobacteraceae bacterium]|nr:aminomethyltransferase beta-barrel domain-containing protein [Acetobacteraceae bacterium]